MNSMALVISSSEKSLLPNWPNQSRSSVHAGAILLTVQPEPLSSQWRTLPSCSLVSKVYNHFPSLETLCAYLLRSIMPIRLIIHSSTIDDLHSFIDIFFGELSGQNSSF